MLYGTLSRLPTQEVLDNLAPDRKKPRRKLVWTKELIEERLVLFTKAFGRLPVQKDFRTNPRGFLPMTYDTAKRYLGRAPGVYLATYHPDLLAPNDE